MFTEKEVGWSNSNILVSWFIPGSSSTRSSPNLSPESISEKFNCFQNFTQLNIRVEELQKKNCSILYIF